MRDVPQILSGEDVPGPEAVIMSWEALHNVFQTHQIHWRTPCGVDPQARVPDATLGITLQWESARKNFDSCHQFRCTRRRP